MPFQCALCPSYEIKGQSHNKPCTSLQYLTPVCLCIFCSCILSLYLTAAAPWERSPFPKYGRLLHIAYLCTDCSLYILLLLSSSKKNLTLSMKTSSSGKPCLRGSFVHTSIIGPLEGRFKLRRFQSCLSC